ncbi:MAG: ABC transporter permease, partial [Hyphomonadaceae bacterium]|nr:ABC transporter permease [Hyphomonadaceae bacterium]
MATARLGVAPRFLLSYAASLGELFRHPGRALLSAFGIAVGVAMGLAVHIFNDSAIRAFSASVNVLSGEADLVVRGPRSGFDEEVFARVARLPGIGTASPAVEVEAKLAGRRESLKVLGLDLLRAGSVQPALVTDLEIPILDLFDADTVLVSPQAAKHLELERGDDLVLQVGAREVRLKVAGLLAAGAFPQRAALMDIASAQWRLDRLGTLNRIDIRAASGVDVAALRKSIETVLPAGIHVAEPEEEVQRGANLSRAYRVNLDMLALVALFTGGFLVFSTQALAVLRRRQHLALLRVLGATPWQIARTLLLEGSVIGLIGAAAGVALGYALAWIALGPLGGDLGAGYFRGLTARPEVGLWSIATFLLLGLATALIGAAVPAFGAARTAPAPVLKAGSAEAAAAPMGSRQGGVVLMLIGAALAPLPAIGGLPVPGYAAVALMLLGAVWLTPALTQRFLALLPLPRSPGAQLAVAQLRGAPNLSGASVAGVVVSFSLMVAMAIMVWSFRLSLEAWLAHVLPADLYVRANVSGDTGYFSPEDQAVIAATRGVARVEFQRQLSVLLDRLHPPVAVLAKPVDAARPQASLALTAQPLPVPAGRQPAWISEAVADLYDVQAGGTLTLPLAGTGHDFFVAGIWRDYARTAGAVVIDRELYTQLTGDHRVTDAALWLAPDASADAVAESLRNHVGRGIEIAEPRVIRQLSLAAFDRTFAITYLLEAVAVLIGLFGISVSFSAQAMARRAEFGMLRHVGMTRRGIGEMLATEGALLGAFGVAVGIVVGFAVSLILVYVVNRQSFHWSMDLHVPWLLLAILAL